MEKRIKPRIYKQWERPEINEKIEYGPTQTDESQKEQTDINNILKRYLKTGQLSHAINENPQFGDFSEPLDYQAAMQTVATAQQQFELLPAHQRERFNNNPQKMLEFLADENNRAEAIKLGILPKPLETPPKELNQAPIEQNSSNLNPT